MFIPHDSVTHLNSGYANVIAVLSQMREEQPARAGYFFPIRFFDPVEWSSTAWMMVLRF